MATFPYGNDSYAMTVILPKKGVSIDSCIDTFSGSQLESMAVCIG